MSLKQSPLYYSANICEPLLYVTPPHPHPTYGRFLPLCFCMCGSSACNIFTTNVLFIKLPSL